MRLRDQTYVAFDTETTGFDPILGRTLEIAAIRFAYDGTLLGQFQTLIAQDFVIPEDVIAIHGITNDMIARALPPADAIKAFRWFLGQSRPDEVVMAHNAPFDIGFLQADHERINLKPPVDLSILDTVWMARQVWPRLRNHKLQTLAEHIYWGTTQEHRAMSDCTILRSVFMEMLAVLPEDAELESMRGYLPYRFRPLPAEQPVVLTLAKKEEKDVWRSRLWRYTSTSSGGSWN